jgi:uncharacterized protein YcbK (DUF882 family)
MKLTKNFELEEFLKSAGIIIEPTNEQIFCMQTLCTNVLQPIRDIMGPVVVTSGLRNVKTTSALIKQGYPASTSSDHYAWSEGNPKATGAADFYCLRKDTLGVFDWIIHSIMDSVGQVIYYPDKNFIHVSNRFSKIFCMADTRKEETRIMIYKNGNFVPYKVN